MIEMSLKELKRAEVLGKMESQGLTNEQVAQILGVSKRQVQRWEKRLREGGIAGLRHGNRGKPSGNRKEEEFRQRVVSRYRERYGDFGPTFASEQLAKEGLEVDHETLRRWLLEEGIWARKKRRKPYRSRRKRRACFGELVQFDGSPHDWFEGRRSACCLMVMVDDATGITYARFSEQETSAAAMQLLWGWVEQYGIPMSLYCDLKNGYKTLREPTLEEQLAGKEPKTAFERACDKLGVQIVSAYSPQAKGRVERRNGILQDRLVKELRLAGICTIEEANRYLWETFLPQFNERFAVEAEDSQDVHVRCTKETKLKEIFCFEANRVVQNDYTIYYERQVLQIKNDKGFLPRPKQKVLVRKYLDETISLFHENRELKYERVTPARRTKQRAG
ncbi:Integrase catalytic region [Spirochaeta thermophila DSM 6578]|uniref:Integrase catalytic region n=1 Tax=Winmispira thermophila (strain ATCC 700085 / DSM 6578 / Z-1203) TaxID=869211 RepID=G0GFI8_WINT7|nr:ISNCY family transposase [Spirochaeta thermophila]AEJ62387.1 Integrase catalytic region [Spirochaeta thermophila DSM 6578]AEJ62464.1 Integrase catalytic region [Spirochaeta thermophila DSM 6578]